MMHAHCDAFSNQRLPAKFIVSGRRDNKATKLLRSICKLLRKILRLELHGFMHEM